jgi:hypothetical protein
MSNAPETGTGTSLQDRSGCLTPGGLAALRSARPGQAPPALAAHLADCVRCQERVLAVDAPRTTGSPRGTRTVAPSIGRTLLLGALVLAAVIAALVTLRQLAGGP